MTYNKIILEKYNQVDNWKKYKNKVQKTFLNFLNKKKIDS